MSAVLSSETAIAPDFRAIRAEFPILQREVYGRRLAFLDNAASSQMPRPVIERMTRYHQEEHANVHRGVHHLSQVATAAYEEARATVARHIGAADDAEIIFTSGTTEAINLVAHGYGRSFVGEGDEILLTRMEHHSNIVPWQMLADEVGARIVVAPMNDRGELDVDAFAKLLGPQTKIVGIVHVSNALGTINPVEQVIAMAREVGAVVVVDGAQALPHAQVDVGSLDCDFYAFSGHKVYGPTGIGVLYGKAELLRAMKPFLGGGDMILNVTFEETTYNDIPHKFEAGTPKIVGAIGLAAALEYMQGIGLASIARREAWLLEYATAALERVEGLVVVGTAKEKASVVSFVLDGVHPHDVGTILDAEGVAVRTGHHCAQPVMDFFKIPATTRASLAFYNDEEDIDALVAGLVKVREIFG